MVRRHPHLLLLGVASLLVSQAAAARTLRAGREAPTLVGVLALAVDGDVVEVPKGRWRGPIVINQRITLRGLGGQIDGGGKGTVIEIKAPGAILERLRVRGSGKDLGENDACVLFAKAAKGAMLRDSRIEDCAFGVWIDQTDGARIEGNRVIGSQRGHRSLRGNGIHLFDASHLSVRRNKVTGGRDGIYVSATEDSVIEGNDVSQTRYCVHYMFSYRNKLLANNCHHNAAGYALMQSRDIRVERNVATDNEGRGLLFRDALGCVIDRNRLERNGEGLFFFSSTENKVTNNLVRGNAVGAKIWAGSLRNVVRGNAFIGNRMQVFFVGAHDLVWAAGSPGNFWSDYLGWDQDGDGIGDRPYRVDSFATALIARFPAAALLLRSPALELLSMLESRMPLLRTPTVIDRHPRMRR